MCGIVGIFNARQPDKAADRMPLRLAMLRHRGPDALGTYASPDGRTLLGHARLSIIDLSPDNNQPFRTEQTVTVFNGEIYNYRELRAALQARGIEFRTSGDTEVLARGYETWGDEVFRRLKGMYAVGIYTPRLNRLTLARDLFGIKPLHVHATGNELRFASEIKALEIDSGRIDQEVLFDLMSLGYPLSDRSLLQGVEQLAPGEVWEATIERWGLCIDRRQLKRAAAVRADIEPNDAELKACVGRSVREHLVADVPLAVSLSGGLDSSIVAAALHRAGAPLHAYTNTFSAADDDPEVEHASVLCRKLGLKHTIVRSRIDDLDAFLREVAWFLEEPVPNPALLHSYFTARALRADGYKVALLGEGADELFGGYPWHRAATTAGSDGRRQFAALQTLRSVHKPLLPFMRVLARRHFEQRLVAQSAAYEACGRERGVGALENMLHFDRRFELVGNQLHRVDRMLMRHGVEGRVPFLYDDVLAAAATISPHRKVRIRPWWRRWLGHGDERQEKQCLAEAFTDELPDEIYRREKWGGRGTVNVFRTPALAQLDDVFRRVCTGGELRTARSIVENVIDWRTVVDLPSRRGKLLLCLLLHTIDQQLLGRRHEAGEPSATIEIRAA